MNKETKGQSHLEAKDWGTSLEKVVLIINQIIHLLIDSALIFCILLVLFWPSLFLEVITHELLMIHAFFFTIIFAAFISVKILGGIDLKVLIKLIKERFRKTWSVSIFLTFGVTQVYGYFLYPSRWWANKMFLVLALMIASLFIKMVIAIVKKNRSIYDV